MAEWTNDYYQAQFKRRKQLVDEVVALVITKHGGFSTGCGWIGLDRWEPGMSGIGVDGEVNLNDLKILTELLKLPSCGGRVEDFDFKKYEDLKAMLEREIALLFYGLGPILQVLQDWKLITWNEPMLHVREEWAKRFGGQGQ